MGNIELLDCTLRDGAYIVDGKFPEETIKGLIKGLNDANIDIIECGWLKNEEHKNASSYFHCLKDFKDYFDRKNIKAKLGLMIDYNRYDIDNIEHNDGTIDLIRITFPMSNVSDGLVQAEKLINKGYKVSFQLTNAKFYIAKDRGDRQLNIGIACALNEYKPECICFADTFGSVLPDEVCDIVRCFDEVIDDDIKIGFHTHNNMQLAFANTISFLNFMKDKKRNIVVDGSLLGMGRGAGNTATEVLANYLNVYYDKKYNIESIYKLIDKYMIDFYQKYKWGYSSLLSVAGILSSHINNISYLEEKHNASSYDVYRTLESMSDVDRSKYDYDLLENKFNKK